jgi:hypothetical protein
MIDRYTKTVLTVIAVSLTVIAGQGLIRPAQAQMGDCGSVRSPCYVNNLPGMPLDVLVYNH